MILKTDLTWIIALCTFVPIFILAVVAVIIRIVKTAKLAKKYNKNSVVNEELKTILLQAFGEDNIVDVEAEMSRLTITVKNIDIVNADVLKANGANGVYLLGNKVKCSFGEKAEEICKLLK